jgi:hypothetical protein
MQHGYYWVQMSQMNKHLTVARLTKNGGWDYFVSEKQSVWAKPYKIISYIDSPVPFHEAIKQAADDLKKASPEEKRQFLINSGVIKE